MWITWRTYTARTEPLEFQFPYHCAVCGVQAHALVQAEGVGSSTTVYGIGDGHIAAQGAALRAAQANASRAIRCAACPQCRSLQPTLVAEFEAALRESNRKKSLRLKVAVAAALVVGLVLVVPALYDLATSAALLWTAIMAVMFVGAGVFTLYAWPHKPPWFISSGVWFWWHPTRTWIPAQPPAVMPPMEVPQRAHLVSAPFAVVGGLGALVAGLMWVKTFQTVYVIPPDRQAQSLTIRLDGAALGTLDVFHSTSDANVHRFMIRTGKAHRIELTGLGGRARTYTIPAEAENDWVITPDGFSRGLCVVEIKVVYGTPYSTYDTEPESSLLNDHADMFALRRGYDHVFEPPPETVNTKAQSETHWALRAVGCNEFRARTLTPFLASAPEAAAPESPTAPPITVSPATSDAPPPTTVATPAIAPTSADTAPSPPAGSSRQRRHLHRN